VCDFLKKKGYKKYAFGDALKQVALPLIHAVWPTLSHVTMNDLYDPVEKERVHEDISFGGKPFSIRWFLQFLGTDVMRKHLSDEIWVDVVLKKVVADLEADPDTNICISDCRFENEVKHFRTLGVKSFTIRVHGDHLSSSPFSLLHESEQQNFEVDFNVDNRVKHDPFLYQQLNDILKTIEKK